MSILTKGTTFATGNQVTAANLNALVDSATFQSTAADDDSTVVSGGKIIVKDLGIKTAKLENSTGTSDGVTTAKIATNAVTLAKMATQADQTVLGNVSGGAAVPSALSVVIGGSGDLGILFDNDDMLDNSDTAGGSATRGATQQSIKAYVDLVRPKYIALTGGTVALTQSTENTYQYNIADFTGSGLTAANIFQIHILCNLQMNFDAGGSNSRVQASYPNAIDTLVTIFQTNRDSGGDSTQNFSSLVTVPINASQSYVKVGLEFVSSGSFQIVGATVFK